MKKEVVELGRKPSVIEKPALKIIQNEKYPVYLFALYGKELKEVASISRIHRDESDKIAGYQRIGIRSHINDIINYLNEDEVLFPNAIITALSAKIKFCPDRKQNSPSIISGNIVIPYSEKEKPLWIVDGQQRVIAIWESERHSLPIPISGFVSDDINIQRDQFIRINNTRPLSRSLINELLPMIPSPLPSKLSGRKIPSILCEMLNNQHDSPFYKTIRKPSTPLQERKMAVVMDNSVILMLEESIAKPSGCLFPYHNLGTGEADIDGMLKILIIYWGGIKEIFSDAWGKLPIKSRLMHGVGIKAMGRLMDKVMSFRDHNEEDLAEKVKEELRLLTPYCRWTSGRWEELGNVEWNRLQNIPLHINYLSDFLIQTFLKKRKTL